MKHLSVKQLWVQEKEMYKELVVNKVPRDVNWSDMLTHHWTGPDGCKMMAGMSVLRRGGSSLNSR